MSEQEPAPGSAGGEPSHDSDVADEAHEPDEDEAREVALMREIMCK
jgi:hypothetical protein